MQLPPAVLKKQQVVLSNLTPEDRTRLTEAKTAPGAIEEIASRMDGLAGLSKSELKGILAEAALNAATLANEHGHKASSKVAKQGFTAADTKSIGTNTVLGSRLTGKTSDTSAANALVAEHKVRLGRAVDSLNASSHFGPIDLDVVKLPPGGIGTAMLKAQGFQIGLPGSTRVAAQNASMTLLRAGLIDGVDTGALPPAVAVLQERPAGNKLLLDIVASVSGHVADPGFHDYDQMKVGMQKHADEFAKTNVYRAEIIYPDGKTERVSFGPGQGGTPEHASVLQGVEIDLARVPPGGKVVVRAAADGSSGAFGQMHLRSVELFVP